MRNKAKEPNGRNGQIDPVILGEIEGEPLYRVIDGFHRCAALKKGEIGEVVATIMPTTWEEVIDLRIMTARTHKVVQFARVVDWVNDSWERTPWADRFNVTQAFVLYKSSSAAKRMGISGSEVSEINDWVRAKCNKWDLSAAVIYNHLSVASIADPQLARNARYRISGSKLEEITPGHLKVIAKALPLRFDMQRLAADTAVARNLGISETRALVNRLAGCDNLEEAQHLTDHLQEQRPNHKSTIEKHSRKRALVRLGTVTTKESVLAPAHIAVRRARELLEKVAVDPTTEYSPEALVGAHREIMALGKGLFDLTQIIEGITKRDRPLITNGSGPNLQNAYGSNLFIVETTLPQTELVAQEANGTSEYFRSEDVASLFDVTERTVINWAADGVIPHLRTVGGHLRYPRAQIMELLNANMDGITPKE